MDFLVEMLYIINIYFSVIAIVMSLIFGFTSYSCIKTVHVNLKILFISMTFAIVILPFAELGLSVFAVKGPNFVQYFAFFSTACGLFIQFIRYIDVLISFERLIATVHSGTYDKKFRIQLGIIFLILCICITIFAANFVTWCKW